MSRVRNGLAPALLVATCLYAQSPIQIHGYIQGRFTDQEGTPDRLEIRRARLIVSGDPLPELSYTLQGDFAKRPYLMDVSATWKRTRWLRLTGGQFKIPFSAESILTDSMNAPVARSRAVLSLAPGRDTGVQARDTGLQVAGGLFRGNSPWLEYTAGVFRGKTIVESPKSTYRATAARVLLHPLPGMTAGADWYGSFSAPAHAEKRRYDVEGSYDRGRVHLRAEQIWARDGTLQRRGGYVLASWRLSSRWEPLVRSDWLTTDVHKADTTSIANIAGLNFYWRRYVKVGANGGLQHDQGPRGDSSVFVAQVMLMF